MKKLFSILLLTITLGAPALNASTGGETSLNSNERMRHDINVKCPSGSQSCGRWYYGDRSGTTVSQFQANYYWPSNHGSRASIKYNKGNGYKYDIDYSHSKSSKAYVSSNVSDAISYYAYI